MDFTLPAKLFQQVFLFIKPPLKLVFEFAKPLERLEFRLKFQAHAVEVIRALGPETLQFEKLFIKPPLKLVFEFAKPLERLEFRLKFQAHAVEVIRALGPETLQFEKLFVVPLHQDTFNIYKLIFNASQNPPKRRKTAVNA
ncbi:hypothetical protein [Phaeobacter sp. 11ANDIMAR09]|uniref:hypothetical protein n=1 Tax=Phaeobacter sp. 11ANDIMAR09 TaxID=1225647 RepID=UPI0006C8CDEB|nr:hypothetical protein [Phaeobacter sp. 11ANDIMAR09]KPD11542.1 hypothetical protein AN476_14955 [Phaeobacter sp. 11ANDIMAR09]